MIYSTARLVGGLGNQMFEIAHAYAQGWRAGVTVAFEPKAFTPIQAHQPLKYLDNIFQRVFFVQETFGYDVIQQNGFDYSEFYPNFNKAIQFDGHYQSSKYFSNYHDKIKELFSPSEKFKQRMLEKYPQLNSNTISIHARRGAYLSLSDILPVTTKSYFSKAMQLHGDYDYVFVFSDDKEWVSQNLDYSNVIVVEGLEDWEELWLMSLCKHNIISNSTFSWWAAYLNSNPDKKVYAPSIWFGPRGEQSHSLNEDYWTIIPVEYNDGQLIALEN